MANFKAGQSLCDFQDFIAQVYALPDDRLFSLPDLLSNLERFTMRALKGIRKGETEKLEKNLLISFSWAMAIANRLHINAESVLLHRFPACCSYCGKAPCQCKSHKVTKRITLPKPAVAKPDALADFQKLFQTIYPDDSRTLTDAGIHLAEEMGELSEAIHVFSGEHRAEQFRQVELEYADYLSCLFGTANSAGVNLAIQLSIIYKENCHVCHKAPCQCSFTYIAEFQS